MLIDNLTSMLTFSGPINSIYGILSSLFFYINISGMVVILALTIKEMFIKTPLKRHPEEDKP